MAEYIFLGSAHGTFSRVDYIMGQISSLGKFNKIEIMSRILSNHNTMRLEINYMEKKCKKYKPMEAKHHVTK